MNLPLRVFGAGRPALALHCSLAHGGAFAALAEALPGWQVTAPDLPGHGRAPAWGATGDLHDAATRGALEILRGLGRPVPVIGHSFGATVALRIALEAPDLVERLVLFEPVLFSAARAAGGPAFPDHLRNHAAFGAALRAGDRRAAAAAFQAIWGAGQPFDSLAESQQSYIADRIHLIEAQNAVLVDDNASLLDHGRLESLGLPVLLVQGALSPPIIGAIHDELARRLPQVSRATVAGAGHMLPITHAGDCAGLVQEFVASPLQA
ncbi:MAG: alpha/beta fold hydrolase [Pseudorhodobacter sp.]